MASRKNKRTKKEEYQVPKPDTRDYAVAKHMHNHIPKRVGDLHGMEVDCFYAEDAVNCLLDSPWATGKDVIFTDRHSVVDFCHEMLCKEMFHRAVLAKRRPKPAAAAKITDGNDTPGESGTESKKSKKKLLKQKGEEGEKSKDPKSDGDSKADDTKSDEAKAKKVKKLKLDMSDEQYFADGREVFVWIYEPVSWTKFIIGSSILIGAIALCCYPLWPEWMRLGVYYLSLAGAAFLGVIVSLAILRYIVWGIVYAVTMGKHSFFMFPNLTEDCGFFESFVPLYEYSEAGKDDKNKKSKKNKDDDKATEKEEAKTIDPPPTVPVPSTDSESKGDAAGDGSDESQGSEGDGGFEVIQQDDVPAS